MALSADRKSERKQGGLFGLPVAASANIYAGALVSADATGYLKPASDTAGETFVGVSRQAADNSAGANADINCEGYLEGVFEFAAAGMTQANLNADVFVVDDETVGLAATTTNDVPVGKIVEVVSATSVFVKIRR